MLNFFLSLTTLLGLMTLAVHAQENDPVPLKNWAAPLSWKATTPQELTAAHQRNAAEGNADPQLALPGGATQLGVLVSMTPCRLVDTRTTMPQPFGAGAGNPPLTWAGGSTHSIVAPNGSCSLPVATAYSVNITVWPQPSGSVLKWLSACPTGTPTATCSAIATLTGYEGGTSGGTAAIVGNAAVIPANSAGSFDVYITDPTWVIIDVNGYYVSPTALSLGSGTAAAPSMTFGTDATSGIYSSGPGTINVATAGANRLTVASNGKVGIGTSTPAQPLEVNGVAQVDGNLNLGGSIYSGTSEVPIFATSSSSGNTSAGYGALQVVSTGTNNTAIGTYALQNNTMGQSNTAVGVQALFANTTGSSNTAVGEGALLSNVGGSANTALGVAALSQVTGSYNIGIGATAGAFLTTGSYNIDIGNEGGPTAESGVIRIGDPSNQSSAFIAGIYNVNEGGGSAVYINSGGQLGTQSSSRRYKEDIEDMGDASNNLMRLRPVTFHYKPQYDDASHSLQYGLIAEEVAEVYPEMVVRSANGQVESVKYQYLAPMLLNELQRMKTANQAQEDRIENQDVQIQSLEEKLANMEALVARLTSAAASR